MSDFKEYTIGTLVKLGVIEKPLDGNHGEIHPKGNDFINSGIPFIMASDIKNSSIDFKNCKFISKKQALTLKKGFAKVGDVLLTHKASIGRSAIIPETNNEYILLTPQVTYYRVKDKQKINNFYLKYYFDSKYFQSAIFSYSGAGSTRAYIGITEQLNLPVKLPSLYTQEQIAAVLSSLDSKIELNSKINNELEAMAKTLYDYWFVQFDFPDKDGKPYKTSGGKMVWNGELKREIPDGWEVVKINETITVKDGTHDSPKSQETGYRFITSKHLLKSGIDFENANLISESDFIAINKRSKVETGDILFSMIGTIGTIYKVEEKEINFAIKNVALFKTSQKKEVKNYVYMYLKSPDMQQYISNVLSGSIQKFIGLGDLRNIPFMLSENLIEQFEKITSPIFLKIENKKIENQTLSNLRDWLLPMLMNGQVTVN